jgi:hypothetical protein
VDVLLTIAFYVCAGLALAGALSSALLSGASSWRPLALLAVAVLLSGPRAAAAAVGAVKEHRRLAQVGALAAAALFVTLAYAAVRGDFVRGAYPGGWFGAAFVGRLLFTRDAMAMQAVAFALLIGLTGAALRVRGGR